MAESYQASALRRQQVLEKDRAYTELARRWGLAPKEERQERIWAVSLGGLRWSLAEELRLAGKELLALRRAALGRLLQNEHRQNQRELQQLGMAFHVERL
ncbi:cilia- and flagella-associated protein 141 [Excalfactoria chinensis]|uniref:cilia- and flagella-associated protein 141 n=1 Tax=Excalfactoria chinensis TaxID=46218 RepID=UPI003B3A9A63